MERTSSKAPQRRGYDHPSFSSTLLDAIYRSIDDERDGTGGAEASRRATDPSVPVAVGKRSTAAHKACAEPWIDRAAGRRPGNVGGRGFPPPIATSSSSDNSSCGGFSSSEPDSATVHPSGRLRPIRTAPAVSAPTRSSARVPPLPLPRSAPTKLAPSPPVAYHHEKKKTSSIRSKLRDLRMSKTPASPGARLAGFINSLFASASRNSQKPKGLSAVASSDVVGDSACSSAPSHSRSCIIKTPSSSGARDSAGKRSVRFYPVSVIVDEDLRPCGQKSVYEEIRSARPSAADRRTERDAKRRSEELLRRLVDDDDEDDDEGSDSSSDLFELEIRRGAGAGLGYRDELPVYETTSHHIVGSNRPLSRIF